MIAVTFALPSESRAFLRLLQNRAPGPPGSHIISGSLHGRAVCVLHTGVGQQPTRHRLERFLGEQTPQLLVSAGFAGALGVQLRVGDLFVAENFSEATLARRSRLPHATLVTTATVIESAAERQQLAQRTGAAAVDMETEWIAAACRAAGVPLLALRVISDSAAEPMPAPAQVLFDLTRQRTPFPRLLSYLARHPAAAFGLIGFAKRIANARQSLAGTLEDILRDLSL